MTVDWPLVKAWRDHLIANDTAPVQLAFTRRQANGPTVVWQPDPPLVRGLANRFLLDYWQSHCPPDGLPPIDIIDPLQLRPALGRILIVEPVGDSGDFRYRLYGSIIRDVSGFDMTGKTVSGHPASSHVVIYALALYQAVVMRGQAVLAIHDPAAARAAEWERVILPVAGPDGRIARLLVGNTAFDRAGRPMVQ